MISKPSQSGETPRIPGYFRKQLIKLLATTSLMTACEEDDREPLPPIQQTTTPDNTTLPGTTDGSEGSESETTGETSEGTDGSTDTDETGDMSTTTGDETTTSEPETTTGSETSETTEGVDLTPPSAPPEITTNKGDSPHGILEPSFILEGNCSSDTLIIEYKKDTGDWMTLVEISEGSTKWSKKIEMEVNENHNFCVRAKKSKNGQATEEDCIEIERLA